MHTKIKITVIQVQTMVNSCLFYFSQVYFFVYKSLPKYELEHFQQQSINFLYTRTVRYKLIHILIIIRKNFTNYL